jgi:hypothetical protein
MQEDALFELFVKDSSQHIAALNKMSVSTEVLLRQQKSIEARLLETEEGAILTTAQRFATSLVLAREKLLPMSLSREDLLENIEKRTQWAEEQISRIRIEGAIRSLSPERR